jgi:hypothetical protein
MSIFNCCTCPEPPDYDPGVDDPLDKYINTCGCPSVSVECESEGKTATLCGFSEFTGFVSSPPKKYLIQDVSYSGAWYFYETGGVCSGEVETEFIYSGSCEHTYDPSTCSKSQTDEPAVVYNSYLLEDDGSGGCSSSLENTSTSNVCFSSSVTSGTPSSATSASKTQVNPTAPPSGGGTRTFVTSLSIEDTEEDALTRETATVGTTCSSLYQLRTTSFSFTKRTVTYTATASNLVVGIAYEGCVRIRKRESYSGTPPAGADTEWEDVAPDTISSFTATATEEEIAADVVVPNVQGYEYQVVSAHVWPVSVGCDCPTSYAP